MTSQGGPYSRFRRAIKTRNLNIIQAAAAELPRVYLDDAAAICAVIADKHPERFEAAAVRWILRLCDERQNLTLAEVVQAAEALQDVGDGRSEGVETLRRLGR